MPKKTLELVQAFNSVVRSLMVCLLLGVTCLILFWLLKIVVMMPSYMAQSNTADCSDTMGPATGDGDCSVKMGLATSDGETTEAHGVASNDESATMLPMFNKKEL